MNDLLDRKEFWLGACALIASAFLGAESFYLLGLEKKGSPIRPALRRIGDLIRIVEAS